MHQWLAERMQQGSLYTPGYNGCVSTVVMLRSSSGWWEGSGKVQVEIITMLRLTVVTMYAIPKKPYWSVLTLLPTPLLEYGCAFPNKRDFIANTWE